MSNNVTNQINTSNNTIKQTKNVSHTFQLQQLSDSTEYNSIFDNPALLKQLQPDTMQSHVRIGLKPELARSITLKIRNTLYRQALNDVSQVERLHSTQCMKPTLISIQPYDVNKMNTVEKLYTVKERFGLEGGGYGGELGFYSTIQRLFNNDLNGQSTVYIGSELWTVNRCNINTVQYHIRYLGENDVFWTKLVPMTMSSMYDTIRVKLKEQYFCKGL